MMVAAGSTGPAVQRSEPVLSSSDLVAMVGVSDLDRARAFYGDVLGLPVTEENPFAVVVDAHGTMLRLTAVGEPAPAPYSVLAWSVDDVAAVARDLVGRGVDLVTHDGLDQDGHGVWTAPDGTRVAWFLDPDGNTLSVVQFAGGERSPSG